MLRICAALIAAATASGAASATELKPKFGDIGGVYYTDVANDREGVPAGGQEQDRPCAARTRPSSATP